MIYDDICNKCYNYRGSYCTEDCIHKRREDIVMPDNFLDKDQATKQKQEFMDSLTVKEIEKLYERFNEYVFDDEIYIKGVEYSGGEILAQINPEKYNQEFNEWIEESCIERLRDIAKGR